ncbi:MAG: hypothetical protein II897_01355 [Clostridia bacterium]|nr:hypothetical protein [Clostridia bacterium]
MNNNEFEYELNTELSPEETACIDRLLHETAEAEDSEVDYSGMLRAIKARAKEEGIVIFPAANKKAPRFTAKRVIASLGTAAAALAMGLAVLAVIKSGTKSSLPHSAMNDGEKSSSAAQTASVDMSVAPGKTESLVTAVPVTAAPATEPPLTTEIPETPEPAAPATEIIPSPSDKESYPIVTEVTISVPTGYPTRGGYVDYSLIAAFTDAPDSADQLIPTAMPEDMPVKESPDELMVYAASKEQTKNVSARFYSCRVTDERDESLEVGVARSTVSNDGSITMLWHAAEDTWLRIEFKGIEEEYAEQLLKSLPLCCSPYSIEDEPAA